jgi:hypothetical protein
MENGIWPGFRAGLTFMLAAVVAVVVVAGVVGLLMKP